MLTSAVVSKSAKTLTLVYSGSIQVGQTWAAGAWTVTDNAANSVSSNATATAGSATQVINFTSMAALNLGAGTVSNPNTAGIVDNFGRILDPVSAFPCTINA